MIVKLEKDYRNYYTLAELDMARAVIKAAKEDGNSVMDYARAAANYACEMCGYSFEEIVTFTATTGKNGTTWDAICSGSGCMDVYIECLAKVWIGDLGDYGYIQVAAYLTDIWKIDGETDLDNKFYVKTFARCKR